MTKEEILSLDTNINFIASFNISKLELLKDKDSFNIVIEEIKQEIEDEEGNKTEEIIDKIIYISRPYKEGEGWIQVADNLF